MTRLLALLILLPLPALADTSCRVIDGDTLKCGGDRIRLVRIDTPERGEPGYRETKDWLRDRIAGKAVTCTGHRRDRYGRLLADCRVDGASLSDELLRLGLAKPYRGRG